MNTDEQNSEEGLEADADHSPGRLLQSGRHKAGLSVEEVADRLKVPESYILAIESNEFEALPGLVFARGYVRSYARVLELDGNELVDHFDRFTGHSGSETTHLKAGTSLISRRPMSPLLAWGASLLTVILVGAGSYYEWNLDNPSVSPSGVNSRQQAPVLIEPEAELEKDVLPAVAHDSEESVNQSEGSLSETGAAFPEVENALPEAVSPPPEVEGAVPEANGSPYEADGSLVSLAVEFAEDCWIQIKDMSGHDLYTDVHRAGSNLRLEVPSSVQVRFGNVKGVADLKFDGKKVAIKAPERGRRVASLVLEAG